MYLSPPDVHCLGPIKMELSEPQANLQAALHVLELHHSKLNTTKVNNKRAALYFSICQTEISAFGQRIGFDKCIKFFTLRFHFPRQQTPMWHVNVLIKYKVDLIHHLY